MILEIESGRKPGVLRNGWAVLLLTLVLAVHFATPANAQTALFSPEAKQRAEALLKQMTVEEKVGQLNQAAGKPDELIAQGKVGSILWLSDVKEIKKVSAIPLEAGGGVKHLTPPAPSKWPDFRSCSVPALL
jgi:hypothetical protein